VLSLSLVCLCLCLCVCRVVCGRGCASRVAGVQWGGGGLVWSVCDANEGVCMCVCARACVHVCLARAEEIASECNSLEAANVIWAQAKLGRKPGESLLRHMEGRATTMVGNSSRGVANTLWAACFLFIHFPDVVGRLTRALSLRPAGGEAESRGQTSAAGGGGVPRS